MDAWNGFLAEFARDGPRCGRRRPDRDGLRD